jgi:hypothetical protein
MRYFISLLGLVVIVGAGYFAVAQYIGVAHGQSSLLTTSQSSAGENADGTQVLALLNRLQAIKLDGKIFTDPNFLSLQDWSVSITAQEVGRVNPYLPAYGAVPAVASTTKVALPKSSR